MSISKGKGDPHLQHRFCWVPLMSLWGMSGGGHFAWVREDFCFSCQVEEIWMEQWLPLSRHRLRVSSFFFVAEEEGNEGPSKAGGHQHGGAGDTKPWGDAEVLVGVSATWQVLPRLFF